MYNFLDINLSKMKALQWERKNKFFGRNLSNSI